jgi:hypothetical protein
MLFPKDVTKRFAISGHEAKNKDHAASYLKTLGVKPSSYSQPCSSFQSPTICFKAKRGMSCCLSVPVAVQAKGGHTVAVLQDWEEGFWGVVAEEKATVAKGAMLLAKVVRLMGKARIDYLPHILGPQDILFSHPKILVGVWLIDCRGVWSEVTTN